MNLFLTYLFVMGAINASYVLLEEITRKNRPWFIPFNIWNIFFLFTPVFFYFKVLLFQDNDNYYLISEWNNKFIDVKNKKVYDLNALVQFFIDYEKKKEDGE